MQNTVQLKAVVPRELKRQAFVLLAAREERFSHWLRTQLALLVRQGDATARGRRTTREAEGARGRM